MTPKVSVVVPVYDPGPYLERCVDSLLGQSLPPGELEVIFVDDGSTDGSGARLDRLASRHSHVRVIHQPNSGWPGKPRNVGIEAARGAYVFFMDHDDALGPEALERLHAMAVRNGSDIVVGKMVGRGRSAPAGAYRETIERTTLAATPSLIAALTAHKLFRHAFLDEQGLRFREGRRRLEDQVFVSQAYFAARVISVVADYPCYYQLARDDRGNAARGTHDPTGRFDPAYYYPFLREVLDVVEAHTEPGPFRDQLLKRFVRRELLARLRGRRFVEGGDPFRAALVGEVGGIVDRYVPPSVDGHLEAFDRVQMALLRAGRGDLLLDLARAERRIAAVGRVRSQSGGDGEPLRLEAEVDLADDDGSLTFERHDDGFLLPVPEAVAAAVAARERTFARLEGTVRLAIRRRGDRREVAIPVTVAVDATERAGRVRPLHVVTAVIAPGMDGLSPSLADGRWDLVVRLDLAGLSCQGPVTAAAGRAGRRGVPLGGGPRPGPTLRTAESDHRLVLDVGVAAERDQRSLRGAVRRVLGRPPRIAGR